MVVNVTSTLATTGRYNRYVIITWINQVLGIQINRVEELCTGVIYCKMMSKLFPESISMKNVKVNARFRHEFLQNLKNLQTAFFFLKINKAIPINEIIQGKLLHNLHFGQWFMEFYNANMKEKGLNVVPIKDILEKEEKQTAEFNKEKRKSKAPKFSIKGPEAYIPHRTPLPKQDSLEMQSDGSSSSNSQESRTSRLRLTSTLKREVVNRKKKYKDIIDLNDLAPRPSDVISLARSTNLQGIKSNIKKIETVETSDTPSAQERNPSFVKSLYDNPQWITKSSLTNKKKYGNFSLKELNSKNSQPIVLAVDESVGIKNVYVLAPIMKTTFDNTDSYCKALDALDNECFIDTWNKAYGSFSSTRSPIILSGISDLPAKLSDSEGKTETV